MAETLSRYKAVAELRLPHLLLLDGLPEALYRGELRPNLVQSANNITNNNINSNSNGNGLSNSNGVEIASFLDGVDLLPNLTYLDLSYSDVPNSPPFPPPHCVPSPQFLVA